MKISKSKKWIKRSLFTLGAYTRVTLLLLSVKYARCNLNIETTFLPELNITTEASLLPTTSLPTTSNAAQINDLNENLIQNVSSTQEPVTEKLTTKSEPELIPIITETTTIPANSKTTFTQFPINLTEKIPVAPLPPPPIVFDCPSLIDADKLSQTQLIERLTHPCRYDHLEHPKPFEGDQSPIKVFMRCYIYFVQNLDAHDLQFKIHILLQLRYFDSRLAYGKFSPNRQEAIMGEASLTNKIWHPHLFLANEKSSSVMGTAERDILTTIHPDGMVTVSKRIQANLICYMNLRKFPFDQQFCSTVFESWMYNTSSMVLLWEPEYPVTKSSKLNLPEYVLLKVFTNETVVEAVDDNLRHGYLTGNYSQISFTLHFSREIGYYIMDYYLPSIMIVAISWVTFWLQADQTAPRAVLGTSTMLTFITLATAQQKALPKVNYIKASEIWFLGCVTFIYASLMEFAFVNIIWRRHKNVQLKKVTAATVLKSTLTPRLARKELNQTRMTKSQTWANFSDSSKLKNSQSANDLENYLTVNSHNSLSQQLSIPSITVEETAKELDDVDLEAENLSESSRKTWTTMKPQEVSCWIDKRSRLAFPMAFAIFNLFYWIFVYST